MFIIQSQFFELFTSLFSIQLLNFYVPSCYLLYNCVSFFPCNYTLIWHHWTQRRMVDPQTYNLTKIILQTPSQGSTAISTGLGKHYTPQNSCKPQNKNCLFPFPSLIPLQLWHKKKMNSERGKKKKESDTNLRISQQLITTTKNLVIPNTLRPWRARNE